MYGCAGQGDLRLVAAPLLCGAGLQTCAGRPRPAMGDVDVGRRIEVLPHCQRSRNFGYTSPRWELSGHLLRSLSFRAGNYSTFRGACCVVSSMALRLTRSLTTVALSFARCCTPRIIFRPFCAARSVQEVRPALIALLSTPCVTHF